LRRPRADAAHSVSVYWASRADIEERLRPLVDGVEDFIAKPFWSRIFVRITKKVIDRLHSRENCKSALRGPV